MERPKTRSIGFEPMRKIPSVYCLVRFETDALTTRPRTHWTQRDWACRGEKRHRICPVRGTQPACLEVRTRARRWVAAAGSGTVERHALLLAPSAGCAVGSRPALPAAAAQSSSSKAARRRLDHGPQRGPGTLTASCRRPRLPPSLPAGRRSLAGSAGASAPSITAHSICTSCSAIWPDR